MLAVPYEFIYFALRGKGHQFRYLFADTVSDSEWVDKSVTFDEWGSKVKQTMVRQIYTSKKIKILNVCCVAEIQAASVSSRWRPRAATNRCDDPPSWTQTQPVWERVGGAGHD